MTSTQRIRAQENALFDEWQSLERDLIPGSTFIRDGLVCESHWRRSSPRLVFILKEANERKSEGEATDWDLRAFLGKGANKGGATWNNVHRWTMATVNDANSSDPRMWRVTPSLRASTLSQIGAVNLKKVPGGGDCDPKKLAEAAAMRRDLILRQLRLYVGHADYFIACGKQVSHLLRDEVGLGTGPRSSSAPMETVGGFGTLMHWRHPNCRGLRWKQVLREWQEALSSR